jgi:hypothetical protein
MNKENTIRLFAPNAPFHHIFWSIFQKKGVLTIHIEEADYILLPFGYEFIIEYTESDYLEKGYTQNDHKSAHTCFTQANQLSVTTGKPMVVIHYRDSAEPFGLPNAIVFRTSVLASKAEKNTFCLPAFVDDFTQSNQPWQPVGWTPKPCISFRGLSAPLQLSQSIQARLFINKIARKFSINNRIKTFFPEGYLLRRSALVHLLRKKNLIDMDVAINAAKNSLKYREDYLVAFTKHPYFLAVAGHGNYSYRLFEIMREGRIPVFINNDGMMPCSDKIDWKRLVIWIEKEEVKYIAEKIMDIHRQLHPDDFIGWQQKIRGTYETYCTVDSFSDYIIQMLFEKRFIKKSLMD